MQHCSKSSLFAHAFNLDPLRIIFALKGYGPKTRSLGIIEMMYSYELIEKTVLAPLTPADSRARGKGDDPQHTYSVRFEGEELWGRPDAGPRDAVYIDLYDTFLEAI